MTKQEFTANIDDWSNHRLLLWEALEATKHLKLPVLELGCGDGSTPYLQQYCKDNNLELFSYDSNYDWARKFGAVYMKDWNLLAWRKRYSVALVDEAPGEHRRVSLVNLAQTTEIVVIHDSEPEGWNASDYQVRPFFSLYKNMIDLQGSQGQAWASALSNFHELNWKV